MNSSLRLPVHFLLIVHSFSSACAQHHSGRLESLARNRVGELIRNTQTHTTTLSSTLLSVVCPNRLRFLTVLAVFKRPAMFASHRFPQRTLLDALVQSASMNSCKHSQRTQQHSRLRFATTSVFLVCYFSTGTRVFLLKRQLLSQTSNCAFSLFDLRAHVLTLTCASSSQYSRPSAPCDNGTTLSFSLRLPSLCVHPALIQMKLTQSAHTGRRRLAPHESSCSETKCWSRYFWRWARSPIRFGPVCSCDVHSTMTAALTMYPAARVLYSVYSGNPLSRSSAPRCLKVAS